MKASLACCLAIGTVAEYGIFRVVRIVKSPCVIGDVLNQRLAHYGNETEGLVVIVDLVVADTLEEHAEIEVVPTQADVGTECETWQCAVANLHTVACVEASVAVGITVEEVAEAGPLVSGEVAGIFVDKRLHVIEVGLIAYYAVDCYDVELIDGFPFLCLVDAVD